jgi:hypothetical protein
MFSERLQRLESVTSPEAGGKLKKRHFCSIFKCGRRLSCLVARADLLLGGHSLPPLQPLRHFLAAAVRKATSGAGTAGSFRRTPCKENLREWQQLDSTEID